MELSGAFNNFGSFGKRNDSTEQLLWTNLCSIVKVLRVKKELNLFHESFDNDILALTLNMCQMLIQKRNLNAVYNNTNEETAKLYKSYLLAGSRLEGNSHK